MEFFVTIEFCELIKLIFLEDFQCENYILEISLKVKSPTVKFDGKCHWIISLAEKDLSYFRSQAFFSEMLKFTTKNTNIEKPSKLSTFCRKYFSEISNLWPFAKLIKIRKYNSEL